MSLPKPNSLTFQQLILKLQDFYAERGAIIQQPYDVEAVSYTHLDVYKRQLLLLKARARGEKGQMAVFFIDDNFAINIKRTKSLLRDIIAAGAQVHWVAQISANLLRDEELVDLIAASGGKWIFIGMESIDPANLKDVNKGFNKPCLLYTSRCV